MKQNYTKFPDKQLDDILKDLKFQLIKSHSAMIEGVKKKHSFRNIKKEIARIKTEQTRRRNGKILKVKKPKKKV